MTEQNQKDKKFNLEDWVTHRAANQPPMVRDESEREESVSDSVQEKRIAEQHSVVQQSVQGVISMNGNGATILSPSSSSPSSPYLRQEKVTESITAQAPVSSSVSSGRNQPSSEPLKFTAALGTASQQIQIVRLLQDLGDRLRASEKEREILWREIESSRKLLNDIEDKTSKSEKAYLSLENKIAAQPDPKADLDLQKKSLDDLLAEQRKLIEKMNRIETTAGSTVVRVEDALSENHKLAKRLDQVAQDKVRLQRKLDIMEETLTATQDSLKAKALVLLTDHALANRTALPQMQAFTDQDKERLSFLQNNQTAGTPNTVNAPSQSKIESNHTWWKQGETMFGSSKWVIAAMIAGLLGLGALGGYAVSKFNAPLTAPVESLEPQAGDDSKSQDQIMADIASMANQIEPAATDSSSSLGGDVVISPSSLSLSPETLQQIRGLEDNAVKNFEAQILNGSTANRIQSDSSLTPAAKELEAKAFAGDGQAQHDLASLYSAGHAGVTANYQKAALWFTESANNNISNAQYNLGVLKQQGLGVKQDTKSAIDLYRVAASQNHPEAEYNLGIASIEGIGADYDPQIAAYYFERAAQGGIVEAAYNLGLIQENGLLGDSQPDEAVFWYKLAADKGHAESKTALAQLQKNLAMNDADVKRIFDRIRAVRPNILEGSTAQNETSAVEPLNSDDAFLQKMKSIF